MIESLDESVGRVLRKLDDLKLADRTIVVFTSDNGGLMQPGHLDVNAPLRAGKGSAYEGGIRVPLIVQWPGVTAAGSVCDDAGHQRRPLSRPSSRSPASRAAPASRSTASSLVPLLREPAARSTARRSTGTTPTTSHQRRHTPVRRRPRRRLQADRVLRGQPRRALQPRRRPRRDAATSPATMPDKADALREAPRLATERRRPDAHAQSRLRPVAGREAVPKKAAAKKKAAPGP